MKKHTNISCDAMLERIELAVRQGQSNGQLDPSLAEHLAACENCNEAYENAHYVRSLVATAHAPVCPDNVVDSILAQIDATPRRSVPIRTGRTQSPRPRSTRWAAAATAIAAILLVALIPGRLNHLAPMISDQSSISEPYSAAEVEAAAEELKIALALVSQNLDRASGLVGSQLRGHIADPVFKSMGKGIQAVPLRGFRPEADEHSSYLIPHRSEC